MKQVAKKLKKESIAKDDYENHGSYSYTTLRRRFKSWYIALEKAGLKSTQQKINNSIEDLLENIYSVWIKLGKQPSYRDLYDKNTSLFGPGAYEGRFGSWNNALIAFSKYIETGALDENPKSLQASKSTVLKRTPRKIGWRLRAQVLIRDNCICQMCGNSPSKNHDVILHIDHIKPWSKGGETVIENLQTLCMVCNIGKSDQE